MADGWVEFDDGEGKVTASCAICPTSGLVPVGGYLVHLRDNTHALVGRMTQRQMYERDGAQCYACGASTPLSEQHRIRKGAGGVSGMGELAAERPSNRLTLCIGCNTAAEADHRFQQTAIRHGWKLKTHENPSRVAAYHVPSRSWRLLDDEGGFTVTDQRDPEPVKRVTEWSTP